MARNPNVAVLLAGCGHVDGAEVREAVLTLLALDQHGATWQCFAPNAVQHHVVDHVTGKPVPGAERNILEEAGRIARLGQCKDLALADPAEFDALLLPGGAGVAKNLCSFAIDGPAGTVRPEVRSFLEAFIAVRKPVGAICIAPALVAMTLAGQELRPSLTLGADKGVAAAVEKLGVRHRTVGSAREIIVDDNLNLVTTAAYMFDDARLSDVWTGIERCVAEVLRRVD